MLLMLVCNTHEAQGEGFYPKQVHRNRGRLDEWKWCEERDGDMDVIAIEFIANGLAFQKYST